MQVDPLHELHGEAVDVVDLVGCESLDDVGVRQARHDLELALELADALLLRGQVAAQDFECHNAPFAAVPGPEHLADTALAQPVQQLVVADGQAVPFAVEYATALILGEPADVDEVLGEVERVVVVRSQLARDLLDLLGRQQLDPAENGEEGFHTVNGHE